MDHTCSLQKHKDTSSTIRPPHPTPAPMESGQPCLSRRFQIPPSPSSHPLSTRGPPGSSAAGALLSSTSLRVFLDM